MRPQDILYAVLGIILFAGVLIFFNQASTSKKATPSPTPQATPTAQVKIEDLIVGTGQEAKSGDTITVAYIGSLSDGTTFDSSYDRGQGFSTQIGTGQVIEGWDQGIPGMKVGGKRRLTVPPELGYGQTGAGDKVPPNSTLIFEVELLDVK